MLAHVHAAAGRYELAEQSALAAVQARESLDGFLLLAVTTMRLNRLNDSIGWLEKAARRRPDHAEIYRILGLDYTLGGMLPEAEQAFRRTVELAPANWEHHYLRGRALFELGRTAESRNCLLEAVRLNALSPRAWTALGQAQEKLGDLGPAEDSYRRALRVCGAGRDCAWPLLQIGFLHGVQSGPAAAIPYYRRAVETRPDWARTHFHLGKALAAEEDLAAARQELERAVELDAAQPEYHYQLATVYRRLGEAGKARAQLAQFRSLRNLETRPPAAAEVAQP